MRSYNIAVSFQYFLYFGVLGIFLPYFNLYCYHLGFTGFQIGTLSGLRSVLLVLSPLLWGLLADRFQIRKPIYLFCNFASTAVWAFYFFYSDFPAMLVITFFYGILFAPIISFLEAFAMDALSLEKKNYGKMRAWGSISFIITVLVLGRILDFYSIRIILVLIFAGALLQAAAAPGLPASAKRPEKQLSSGIKMLLKRRVVIFLFCAFLMLVSHGAYYGFFSIHLEKMGYGKTFIGISWAIASIAEIIVMINSDRIFNRFSFEKILFISFLAAVFRWFMLGFISSPAAILCCQILHALTYGAFHMASILYIDSVTPDQAKTLGQAVNNAITYGLGLVVGFFISGYLFEVIGPVGLFFISGVIALAAGVLFKGFQIIDSIHP